MKSKIDTINWVLKWIALVSAVFATIVIPHARIAWGCCVIWIIGNMFQQKMITRLEQEYSDLSKENCKLYDELYNIRRKKWATE